MYEQEASVYMCCIAIKTKKQSLFDEFLYSLNT